MKTILLTAGSIVAISIATFTATTAAADHGHGMGQAKVRWRTSQFLLRTLVASPLACLTAWIAMTTA